MKMIWIGIGIVMVIAAMIVMVTTISYDRGEEAQNIMLNKSDEVTQNIVLNRSTEALLETAENIIDHSSLEEQVPFSYDQYMDENMRKIVQNDLLMAMGDSVTLYADVDEGEDLLLFTTTFSHRDITARRPDGSVSLVIPHTQSSGGGFFDHPLIIPVDMAGTWSVTVTMMTDEEAHEAFSSNSSDRNYKQPPQFSSLLLASRPAAVELDLQEEYGMATTDDPYLLAKLVGNMTGTVVVTHNVRKLEVIDGMGHMNWYEEPISLSQPLADGRYFLLFRRVSPDGRISKVTHLDLMVDTIAPEITLGDFERETNFPYVLLRLTLSDNVMAFYINGGLYSHTERLTEIQERMPLEMGANLFELRAVNHAGHETVCTVTVTRTK